MHAKIFFFWSSSLLYENTIWVFFSFERLGRMHENKNIYFFLMFWWKPGILIPDLYFYDIKIQTDINPKWIENYTRNSQMFLKMYIFF